MDGEPLFAGDSDLDQLYRIQTTLGPMSREQQLLFASNPHNTGVSFNITEPERLSRRCVCMCVCMCVYVCVYLCMYMQQKWITHHGLGSPI